MAFTPKLLQQGAGGGLAKNYIEDVFSTYLYTGNASTQTITNGIDLSTKGGLVWLKNRTSAVQHGLTDTARGINKILYTNLTSAEGSGTWGVNSFNSTGFGITGTDSINNQTSINYASWTFRKQPKFFDIVTYTGNGTSGRTVAHNLGSVPGCIIVKKTSSSSTYGWCVYHRSLTSGSPFNLCLNTTDSQGAIFNGDVYSATDTTFSVSSLADVNQSGQTFVAYLFAHDAGGFGLTGTDNVISCGSFTTNGSGNATVTLGYEPQFVLYKTSSTAEDWNIVDVMRGFNQTALSRLKPNVSNAEANAGGNYFFPTATGFTSANGWLTASQTYIYIAIRRGPMKVPTSGTSVFSPEAFTGNATTRTIGGITTDSLLLRERASDSWDWSSRLTESDNYLQTNNTTAESSATAGTRPSYTKAQLGVVYNGATKNQSGTAYIDYLFKRAPSFFDEVCYTGNGSGLSLTHNLTVAPELIIVKKRSAVGNWIVRPAGVTNNYLVLNSTANSNSGLGNYINNPTATTFGIGDNTDVNANGATFVAYLFATCAGVSKVGSYTGTSATLQIDCGFTSGVRFVLIKRTDSNGGWFVWDSARGIVSGNDPYLRLESTAAEVTNTDYVDSYSAGFELNASATDVNNSGASYIFLAIA